MLDRDDKVGNNLRCFDLSNGKGLWTFSYEAPGSVMFPGSRSVPTVDGNYIYSCGQNGDLYCVDIKTHKPLWNVNVWTDFGGKPNCGQGGFGGGSDTFATWAITQCPLIYGDLLIIASQAPDAGVAVYDKLKGEVKWKTPSLGAVGYVSPAIVKVDRADHVVIITASDRRGGSYGNAVGINPLTGKVSWKYAQWDCHLSVPSAVDAGDNKVLVVGGYELGAVMIKVERKADNSYSVTELYKTEEFGAHTKPPILHNGYFYAQYGTNNRRDGLVCMSMDGKIMWKTKRSPNFDKGSMILADGLILTTDGRKTLYLIDPDQSEFKPIASAELLGETGTGSEKDSIEVKVGGSARNWAPMALADGKLLVRDQRRMKCVKVVQ